MLLLLFQDPSINIAELKDIHSEINLTVPDPILVPHLHDGLDTVRRRERRAVACVRVRGKSRLLLCPPVAERQKEEAGGRRRGGHG